MHYFEILVHCSLFLNLCVPPFSGKVISCFTKSVVVRDELEIRALIGSLVKKMVFANDIFTVDFIKKLLVMIFTIFVNGSYYEPLLEVMTIFTDGS
jgi:hypothetical protein